MHFSKGLQMSSKKMIQQLEFNFTYLDSGELTEFPLEILFSVVFFQELIFRVFFYSTNQKKPKKQLN